MATEYTNYLKFYRTQTTDAVLTTLTEERNNADKLEKEFVRRGLLVTAFGAKPHEEQAFFDNTTAIQNALDYAANNGGGIVLLPYGTFYTAGPLTIKGNTLLLGVGRRASMIKLANNSNCDVIKTPVDTLTRYYMHLANFGVDGNAQYQETGTSNGIVITNMAEAIIDNISIYNPRKSGLIFDGQNDQYSTIPMVRNLLLRGSLAYTEGDAVAFEAGSYDAIVDGIDAGFFKNGAGLKLKNHHGASFSGLNLWQNRFGVFNEGGNRNRFNSVLSDYANRAGFYFTGCLDNQLSNCQSRYSSVEATGTHDGFYMASCTNLQMDNPKVLSAAAGTTGPLDGKTRHGINLVASNNVKISNHDVQSVLGNEIERNSGLNLSTDVYIDGVLTCDTLPTAAAKYRGRFANLLGAAPVADVPYVCRKTTSGTSFAWVRLDT